jgi:hypothetical protein
MDPTALLSFSSSVDQSSHAAEGCILKTIFRRAKSLRACYECRMAAARAEAPRHSGQDIAPAQMTAPRYDGAKNVSG